MSRSKLPPYQKKKSFPQIQVTSPMATHIIPERYASDIPRGIVVLENQVAGHTFQTGTDAIGLLKDQHDGSIMKPAMKPMCGVREIKFYENLYTTTDENLSMLIELVPEYRGTVRIHLGGKDIDFIKLTDLTHGMLEPCIMDVKIGQRTWDPLASDEKRLAEESKYSSCKKKVGFCIPGFQVYNITSGKCKKYNKDYGKKLNECSVRDAFKIFLNAEIGFNRSLLMHFLSGLWSVQKWARIQKSIKLYSSSLLLVYDARRLRNNLEMSKKSWSTSSNGSLTPTGSNSPAGSRTPPISLDANNGRVSPFNFPERKISEHKPIECYRKVQRSHSSQNNYDEDLKEIKQSYEFMLSNMIANNDNKEWAFIKMIDFAHVFPTEDDAVDSNYLFGIDNLVKIFEEFLKDCD